MMTTFIEVRTLWTFHGDTMVPLQKIEWIFTLWKLLAEVAGIGLFFWGARGQAPPADFLLQGGHPLDPPDHLGAGSGGAGPQQKNARGEKDNSPRPAGQK